MLGDKRGVITEDRFKNMTSVQWMFHYTEVMQRKQAEIDADAAKIKIQQDMFMSIVGLFRKLDMSIWATSFSSHPKMNLQKVIDNVSEVILGGGREAAKRDLMEFYEKSKADFPDQVKMILDTEAPVVLGKKKK